jgi:hypothetical protein
MVGRVTPCAPLLTSKRTSFPQPPPSQCFTLKKQIMQVRVFTTCYVRIQSAQAAGRVAPGFPLPSTGRGIEGEGWSYPELPPVSSCINTIPRPGLTLKTENFPQNPRNITFLQLETSINAPTIIQRLAHPRVVGRVTPCAPLLTSKRTSFLQPPPSQCFTLKKQIMQVPVFTTCYVRIQSAQAAGRVATGFPLPSTGRGIEGEGWSYPELPPVRFFLFQHPPGVQAEHFPPKIPELTLLSP